MLITLMFVFTILIQVLIVFLWIFKQALELTLLKMLDQF